MIRWLKRSTWYSVSGVWIHPAIFVKLLRIFKPLVSDKYRHKIISWSLHVFVDILATLRPLTGRKYVQSPCNCLLICKSSSQEPVNKYWVLCHLSHSLKDFRYGWTLKLFNLPILTFICIWNIKYSQSKIFLYNVWEPLHV